jgi:hypothetical protein
MANYVEIGALVDKSSALNAYKDMHQFKGVEYAILETGRSNDLFSEKQFGEFGEAAILTLVVETKQKNSIMKKLTETLGIGSQSKGLVYEEKSLKKVNS